MIDEIMRDIEIHWHSFKTQMRILLRIVSINFTDVHIILHNVLRIRIRLSLYIIFRRPRNFLTPSIFPIFVCKHPILKSSAEVRLSTSFIPANLRAISAKSTKRTTLALRISMRILRYAIGMQISRKHPIALFLYDSVIFFLILRRIQELLASRELAFQNNFSLSQLVIHCYFLLLPFVVDILLFHS